MKKLTFGQIQALLTAVEVGIFPDTDTPVLRAAVEKLRDGLRIARIHVDNRNARKRKEDNHAAK